MVKTQQKKVTVNRKLIAAVTLLVALALTVVFVFLGVTGRRMDKEGLRKLLPWLPTTSQSSSWRQALVPGAGLGDTLVETFAPVTEGEVAQADLEKAVKVVVKRLYDLGWTDAAVQIKDKSLLITLPEGADIAYLNTIIQAKGEFTFTDPDGAVFMTGENVTKAEFGYADQSGTNIALSLAFDAEGKQAFGQKSLELAGQAITISRDGQTLASPGINEPILGGQVSIPGFDLQTARDNAIMLRSGALPFALQAQGEAVSGQALLGSKAQSMLIISLSVVFGLVAVYLIVCYRLGGLVAAWMLLLQLSFSWFLAALIGAGFTVLTLSAIMLVFVVTAFAIIRLYSAVGHDIRRGRSIRQALKDGYAGPAHAGLDVQAGLLLISVVFILMNTGIIRVFSEVFALALLLSLVITQVVHRVLLNETIHLFGGRDTLYAAGSAPIKEG